MSTADATWLVIELPHNLMVITAVLEFVGPVDRPRLQHMLIDELAHRYPRFGQRVVPGRWPVRRPAWQEVGELDLDYHLQQVEVPGSLAESLPGLVSRVLSRPLDMTRPPWQFLLVTGPASSALIARLHHCIADGIALASVLLTLTDSEPARTQAASPTPSPAPRPVLLEPIATALRLAAGVGVTSLQIMASRPDPHTALRGRLAEAKGAAWTDPLELAGVKAVAAAAGGSVNDVLLAVTAGALRRTLLSAGQEPADLRVFVPVNVRRPGAPVPARLGNRFGLLLLRLPVAEADPLARVRAVSTRTRALKAGAQALATYTLLNVMGASPAPMQRWGVRLLGTKASAIVTNVPGPRQPTSLAGSTVSRLIYWVPQPGSIGIGVSIFSYAGGVTLGVAADAGLMPDPAQLTAAMVAEFDLLRGAAGVAPG